MSVGNFFFFYSALFRVDGLKMFHTLNTGIALLYEQILHLMFLSIGPWLTDPINKYLPRSASTSPQASVYEITTRASWFWRQPGFATNKSHGSFAATADHLLGSNYAYSSRADTEKLQCGSRV
jgi:hypothetical protein